MKGNSNFKSFEEFWPAYLQAHSKPATRMVHFAGGLIALGMVAAFFATFDPTFLLAAIVTIYAFAWISHFAIQHNKPASFQHPLWSALSGCRMFGLWISGGLNSELVKAGLPASKV